MTRLRMILPERKAQRYLSQIAGSVGRLPVPLIGTFGALLRLNLD
jgi:hypothetical protein